MLNFLKKKKIIPVVHMSGIIGNIGGLRNGITISSIENLLEKAFKIKNSAAVAIIINSPGGSPVQSSLIYKRIKKLAKKKKSKVIFFVEDVAASGGYYIACAGDEIYASYGSLVGSIGVKGPDWIYFDKPISMSSGIFGKAIETEYGIKVYSQNAGKSKDLFNPFRQPTKEELQNIQLLIDDIYDDFVNLVSKKRKIEINIIKSKIGALIYNSRHAKNNYLIDGEINLNLLILLHRGKSWQNQGELKFHSYTSY